MTMRKTIAGVLAALCLAAGMTLPVLAVEDGYAYAVTVSGGKYGTVASNGPDAFAYGERWNPNDYEVEVTDAKYYFKGFHISGQEGVVGAAPITKDTVFVATYGVRGNTVAYTVNYVDDNGAALRPSQTMYGNVGDKPLVAYIYIEGYMPHAYNLTRTLSENEAQNVFTFTYTPELEPEPEPTPTPVPTAAPAPRAAAEPTAAPEAAGTTTAGTAGAETPGETAAPEESEAAEETPVPEAAESAEETPEPEESEVAAEPPEPEEIGDEEVPQAGPLELEDLDDNDAPLANFSGSDTAEAGGDAIVLRTARTVAIIGALGLIAVIIALWYLLARKRRSND